MHLKRVDLSRSISDEEKRFNYKLFQAAAAFGLRQLFLFVLLCNSLNALSIGACFFAYGELSAANKAKCEPPKKIKRNIAKLDFKEDFL